MCFCGRTGTGSVEKVVAKIIAACVFWNALAVVLPAQTSAGQSPFRMEDWAPAEAGTLGLPRGRWGDVPYFSCQSGPVHELRGQPTVAGFGFMANRDCDQAPLPKAHSHGYAFHFGWLHEGDVVPLFGHLYRMLSLNVDPPPLVGAKRLPAEEVPKGIGLRLDTYLFPLSNETYNAIWFSGTLHKHYVYVWEISPSRDKPDLLRAKVGTLADIEKSPYHASGREKEIVWKWVQVGDHLEVGKYRHEVVRIVPPKKLPDVGGREVMMSGWIELNSKPVENPDRPE